MTDLLFLCKKKLLMFDLLKDLCKVHSPSGEESAMKAFILKYVNDNRHRWKVKPEIIEGPELQDCVMLRFGKPGVAAIAHMDTTGFMVRYENQLIPIGSPDVVNTDRLRGADRFGSIECGVAIDEEYHVFYEFSRPIISGTTLTYIENFVEDDSFIYSPYLDNRAGIFNLLKVAETLENGLLIFSCWEEHGGGSVPYLTRYFYEKYGINKVLISDITWVTDGVHFDEGVAISLRDRHIPRRSFVDKIIELATESEINFQVEVEGSGSSDGREIQMSPYPIDWCFVGAPEEQPHASQEKVSKRDLISMISLYKVLFEKL